MNDRVREKDSDPVPWAGPAQLRLRLGCGTRGHIPRGGLGEPAAQGGPDFLGRGGRSRSRGCRRRLGENRLNWGIQNGLRLGPVPGFMRLRESSAEAMVDVLPPQPFISWGRLRKLRGGALPEVTILPEVTGPTGHNPA